MVRQEVLVGEVREEQAEVRGRSVVVEGLPLKVEKELSALMWKRLSAE